MTDVLTRIQSTFNEVASAVSGWVPCDRIVLHIAGQAIPPLESVRAIGENVETLIVPLSAGGEVVARLHVSRKQPFTPAEHARLNEISPFVAASVLGMRETVRSLERLEEAQEMLAVGRATASLLDPAEVALHAAAFISRLVHPNQFAIFVTSEDGRYLEHLTSANQTDAARKDEVKKLRFALAGDPSFSDARRRAFFEGTTEYVGDAWSLPGVNVEMARHFGVRAHMAVPIRAGKETLGLLEVGSPHAGHNFGESVTRLLEGIADQLAISLRNARLARENIRRLEELRAISRRLWSVQEEERRRIARELHDEAGQAMTALKLNLDLARRESDPEKVKGRVRDAVDLAANVLEELRRIARDLRPASLDDLGLVPAVRALVDGFGQRTGLIAEFDHDSSPVPPPNSDAAATVFRFVQEALTNVARHAKAKRVRVEVHGDNGDLEVEVEDDGVGFEPEHEESDAGSIDVNGRLGILGMRERARLLGGKVTLESREGRGARLRLRIPVTVPGSTALPPKGMNE